MNPLKIAIAGAGLIGQAHIAAIQDSTDCRVAAIVDPVPAAKTLADRLSVPWFADLDTLFQSAKPDGIVLATPNHLHETQALQCLTAGVPTLLEKPIAPTLIAAQAIVDAQATCGVPLMVGHHRAHSPIMAQAKAAIDSGVLGKLVSITGSAQFFKPDEYWQQGAWRAQPGGGPILLNMIHEVHNLRTLCGEIDSVHAFASHAARAHAVEDTVSINLRFRTGVLGTFLLSDAAASPKSWEQTSGENKAYASYADQACYSIAGMAGSLDVPTMRVHRYASRAHSSWWKPFICEQLPFVRSDPLVHQIAHFCAVIRGQQAPIVSAMDGYQNLRITEAIAESARTGSVIDLAHND